MTRRLFSMTILMGLAAGGALVGATAPAQAVPGVTVVSTPSVSDSGPKHADAVCPVGTVVYGAAGRIVNGGGSVTITDMRPNANLTSVRVNGAENDAYADDWRVVAIAICGPDNGHNLRLEEVASAANGSNLSPRSTFAVCDTAAGEVMFGTGYRLENASGNVLIAEVEPDVDPFTGEPTGVEIEVAADNGFAGNFNVFAYAVCGIPNGSTVSVATGTSATGTDPSYTIDTSACAQGDVTGVGGKNTDGVYGILLDRFELNAAFTRSTVRGWDNAGGNTYEVTAFAICSD
jgi:hypothetical protein